MSPNHLDRNLGCQVLSRFLLTQSICLSLGNSYRYIVHDSYIAPVIGPRAAVTGLERLGAGYALWGFVDAVHVYNVETKGHRHTQTHLESPKFLRIFVLQLAFHHEAVTILWRLMPEDHEGHRNLPLWACEARGNLGRRGFANQSVSLSLQYVSMDVGHVMHLLSRPC